MFWGGAERRKSIRVQIRMTLHVQVAGQPRYYEAMSRDLSAAGACVFLRKKLEHCTSLYCEFRLPGALETLYCPGHVAWAQNARLSLREGEEKTHVVGIEFTQLSRAARRALKSFIAKRTKGK